MQEKKEKLDEFEAPSTQRPWSATIGLLITATIGLTFQTIHVFIPHHESMAILPAIAWVSSPQVACGI